MLLTIQNIQKYFGAELCLRNISCVLDAQDRAGIIGENGAGKTTLIKIITGELYPDDGIVTLAHGATVGYLEQNSVLDPACTVYGEMENAFRSVLDAMDEMKRLERQMAECPGDHMLLERHAQLSAVVDAADGYNMDTQIKKILNGMAFPAPDYQKSVAVLSGGEHTRLCLAKLLLQKPDLLILDEPTNHLDFETMEWLESYLKTYPGAILVVSHDRYFLDAVCNRIFEIEDNTLTAYKGNYSAYLPQKEAAVALQQKQHDADMEKAAKLEDYIARNLVRASTTKMAQSRRKQLEKMEITEAPRTSHTDLKFRFTFDVTPYNEILTAKNISVTLGGKRLVEGLDLLVKRGERLVIAGPNGAGKSTLLRVLDGKLRPQAGTVRLGAGAKPSVFEQQQLRRDGTVISTIWDKYPKFTELEVRSHLAKLNFRGEDVFKPCSALSGGELARLRFAEILLEKPNLLFLDEPTNHLDIYTRESLGAALASYEGTLVLVTHDRYLMNSLACPILFIENGKTSLYEDYDAMMHRGAVPPEKNIAPEKTASAGKAAYGKDIDAARVTDVEELGGHGVTAKVDGKLVAAGNARLMAKLGLTVPDVPQTGTIVHVAIDGKYAGYLLISDVVKPHSAQAIKGLKQAGVRKTVMLTGDAEPVAKAVSAELGIDEYHAGLLPGDKVDRIEKLLAAKNPKEMLAFVGDGINDAPVLSRADVGIAMGALGSDAAIEAADVVLMDDDPAKIALAMRIARRTKSIVYQNIVFALAIKAACLLLGALGIANMWLAIFADVGVMVLAVLNAIRALFVKNL